MPEGLNQKVERRWTLSHGERARLFIARSLLQGSDLVILDEGLAYLDPETVRRSTNCVLQHAPSLLVIGHA
jgi:ATP-binding cassette subfamily B protein